MSLILVPEEAEFPKLFGDLTPKVSNSMLPGTIWENYSLQRIFNAFKSSNFKDFILHEREMAPGVFKAFLYHVEFK